MRDEHRTTRTQKHAGQEYTCRACHCNCRRQRQAGGSRPSAIDCKEGLHTVVLLLLRRMANMAASPTVDVLCDLAAVWKFRRFCLGVGIAAEGGIGELLGFVTASG